MLVSNTIIDFDYLRVAHKAAIAIRHAICDIFLFSHILNTIICTKIYIKLLEIKKGEQNPFKVFLMFYYKTYSSLISSVKSRKTLRRKAIYVIDSIDAIKLCS